MNFWHFETLAVMPSGAAGKIGDQIPLCHPLALTAVQVALLTVYDMCKAVDKGMVIEQVRLLEKLGGKSGHYKVEG